MSLCCCFSKESCDLGREWAIDNLTQFVTSCLPSFIPFIQPIGVNELLTS